MQGGNMKRYSLVLTLISLMLVACSGPRTYAEKEEFHSDSRHNRNFSAAEEPVCEAARRVLLRDGYIVEESAEQTLSGAKEFQIEENRHAILRLYANCSPRSGGSTLYVTATEEHFDVKTSRQSTSFGVPLISPLSIGSKSEVDNQVKIRGETVTDKNFYERFYKAVQQELGH
jgi:hypothetical protein